VRLSVHGKYEVPGKESLSAGAVADWGSKTTLIEDLLEFSTVTTRSASPNAVTVLSILDILIKDLQQKEAPEAYMMYALYDADSMLYETGKEVLTKNAANQHEVLEKELYIAEDGYMEAFLVNETEEDVWFDNFTIMSEGPLIVQESHYDPWGLELTGLGYQYGGIKVNKYLYQGKELLDDQNLNIYDFHARGYDPVIGRTWQLDPHAFNYYSWSPYSWTGNNPISNIDPDGKDWYRYKNEIQWFDDSEKRRTDDDGNKWRNIGTELLQFDGTSLTYSWQTTNDEGQRQVNSLSFDAVSGKPVDPSGYWNTTRAFDYSQERQGQENIGPTPEGIYSIRKSAFNENSNPSGTDQYSGLSAGQKLKSVAGRGYWPGSKHSWGEYRWKLQNEGSETYGRSNFYLHGGGLWGSRGCIDCGSGIVDFRNAFLGNQLGNDKVYLQVKYPANQQVEVQNRPTTMPLNILKRR